MNASVHTVYVTSSTPLPGLKDLDIVRLTAAVEDDEARLIEAGSRGTIVAVYANGAAYEVDFVEPFETNATVPAEKLVLVTAA